MPIDPSIPLNAGNRGGFSLNDILQRSQERDYRDQQMQMQQRQATRQDQQYNREETARGSLADLIKNRRPDGSIDTQGPAFQNYAQNDPEHAYAMLDKLDATQREHAQAGLKDMAGDVQWATTPERWAIVQRSLGQHDPQIAQLPFEQREQALIHLGQMSKYLESQKLTWHPIGEQGAFATDAQGNPVGEGNPFAGPTPPQQQPQGTPTGSPLVRLQAGATARPAGMTDAQLFEQAHEAVRHGANVDEVFRRLQSWGVNP